MKISIIIPTFNRSSMLRQLLTTIRNDTISNASAEIEIIVVDDLSTDETYSMVQTEFPEVTIIRGVGKNSTLARRKAIEASHGDYIVDIDDDALPEKGWIKEMLPDLIRGEKIIQAKVIFIDLGEKNIEFETRKNFRIRFRLSMYPEAVMYGGANSQYIKNCQEIGLFISRDVLKQVTLDDPNLTVDFGEASSFFIRASKRGYKVFFQPRCVINHYGAGFGGLKEREQKISPKKNATFYTSGMVHNFFLLARMFRPWRIPYMIGYYLLAGCYLSLKQHKFCLPFFIKGIIGGLKATFKAENPYNLSKNSQ